MNLVRVSPLLALYLASQAQASILPPNNLHLQDRLEMTANMTEAEFNQIINDIVAIYKPVVARRNATLTSNNLWTNSTVNASAQQNGNTWIINMYGGLARRNEVTKDGFAMVVCHELGHHLGGFAFYGNGDWAASEGQSDYFATQACAREIWKNQKDVNASFRGTVGAFEKDKCDRVWSNEADQNLCYRTAAAGQSLAWLLSALNSGGVPKFDTPDRNEVSSTNTAHPAAQCRLDTYFNGALCSRAFDINTIPGRNHASGQTSVAAEEVASQTSCMMASGFVFGNRPRCWYKPNLEFLGITYGKDAMSEIVGNDNGVVEPGETVGFKFFLGNDTAARTTGVKGSLVSATTGVQVLVSEATFPDLEPGKQAANDQPFQVRIDENFRCGAKFDVSLSTRADKGARVFTKSYQVGKITTNALGRLNPGTSIPDASPAGITSSLKVDATGAAASFVVDVDITHSYIGDLVVTLVAPNGTSKALHNRAGGSSQDLKKSFTVDLPVDQINGDWKLKVQDMENGDTGKLNSWSLTAATASCAAR